MNGLLMKYFVLSPMKDDAYGNASRRAMQTYAMTIAFVNPELANDLNAWVDKIEYDTQRNKSST